MLFYGTQSPANLGVCGAFASNRPITSSGDRMFQLRYLTFWLCVLLALTGAAWLAVVGFQFWLFALTLATGFLAAIGLRDMAQVRQSVRRNY
ncbi:MAG TPA: hypothetical protein VFK82_00050, partial [Burkholderiaceae bacterium]|nr:hypothetical protein [Burkholderiaceae bacterium]